MQMWKKTLLALLLLALVLVVALARLPAQTALAWLSRNNPQLSFEQVSGTLWAGKAGAVRVRGVALGALDWTLSAGSLLRMAPVLNASLQAKASKLSATVQRMQDGRLVISNLIADADASWLAPVLGIPMLTPTGQLDIKLAEIEIAADGRPLRALGTVAWENAGVTGAANAKLGGVLITLNGSDRITGTIAPLGANPPLQVSGGFELLALSYSASVRIQPNTSDPQLLRALEYVGQPLTESGAKAGSRLLEIKGELLLANR
jgi:general secretion pathway protein N